MSKFIYRKCCQSLGEIVAFGLSFYRKVESKLNLGRLGPIVKFNLNIETFSLALTRQTFAKCKLRKGPVKK